MQRWQVSTATPRSSPAIAGRPSNSENWNFASIDEPSWPPASRRRGSSAAE
jgi:hypothetical protein